MSGKSLARREVAAKTAQKKKGPKSFSMEKIVEASIIVNNSRYFTLISEGSTQMELLHKAAKENGGGVVKLYYPEYGTWEIVGIKIGNDVLVKGDPKALENADYSGFRDGDSAKRFFLNLSREAERNGGGGIHSFIGSGIPVMIDEKGNLIFPNFYETPVTRETNEVEFKEEHSKSDPRTIKDILNMYGRKESPSDILRKAEKSHGGARFEKIDEPNNILLIDKDTGEIRSPVSYSNGTELPSRCGDEFNFQQNVFQPKPAQTFFSPAPALDGCRREDWTGRFYIHLFDGCENTQQLQEEGLVEFFFSPPPSSGITAEQPVQKNPSVKSFSGKNQLCFTQPVGIKTIPEMQKTKKQVDYTPKKMQKVILPKKEPLQKNNIEKTCRKLTQPMPRFDTVPNHRGILKQKMPSTDYVKKDLPLTEIKIRRTGKKLKKKSIRIQKDNKKLKKIKKLDPEKKKKIKRTRLRKLKRVVKQIILLLRKLKKKKKSFEKPWKEVKEKRDQRKGHNRLNKLLLLYVKLKKSVTVKKRNRKKVDSSDNKIKGKGKTKCGIKKLNRDSKKRRIPKIPQRKQKGKKRKKENRTEYEISGWAR